MKETKETVEHKEIERLENEAEALRKRIDKHNDFFFIYGWSRRLEEIEQEINKLNHEHKN